MNRNSTGISWKKSIIWKHYTGNSKSTRPSPSKLNVSNSIEIGTHFICMFWLISTCTEMIGSLLEWNSIRQWLIWRYGDGIKSIDNTQNQQTIGRNSYQTANQKKCVETLARYTCCNGRIKINSIKSNTNGKIKQWNITVIAAGRYGYGVVGFFEVIFTRWYGDIVTTGIRILVHCIQRARADTHDGKTANHRYYGQHEIAT